MLKFAFAENYIGLPKLIANIERLIVNPIIILMFAIALAVFIYGVFQFIMTSDTEEGKQLGKQHIMWGLIGMFIMIAVFTIMRILINTIGVDKGSSGGYIDTSGNHQPRVNSGDLKVN